MTTKNDRFWAKVLFREFIKHYRKMTDEQIVRDVRQSMDDLDDLVDDTDTFGSKMVRWSAGRAEQYPMARENGKKGGRPRKNQDTTADAPARENGEFKSDSGDAGNLESATSAKTFVTTTEATTPCTISADGPRQAEARQSQGRTGGDSVRGGQSIGSPVRSYRPRKVPHPQGEYEVFDFAGENGIPEWVANEFYQRFFVERDGTDNDGNNIDNWKGALINYNKSRKREPA